MGIVQDNNTINLSDGPLLCSAQLKLRLAIEGSQNPRLYSDIRHWHNDYRMALVS